jgi:hypothetical protein
MQLDPDYLRRHYSSLSDEALLAINRNDLVEAAQAIFDEEVNRRREAEKNPLAWLNEASEVYSVAAAPEQSGEPAVASSARNLLEVAGIPCCLRLTEVLRTETPTPSPTPTSRWCLSVPAKENLRATSVLEQEIGNPEFEAIWRAYLQGLSEDELLAMDIKAALPGLFDRISRVKYAYKEEIARRGFIDMRILI